MISASIIDYVVYVDQGVDATGSGLIQILGCPLLSDPIICEQTLKYP